MITRWHLLNLPVYFSGHRYTGLRVSELLMDWPSPTLQAFLLRRRWRLYVLPVSADIAITAFGLEGGTAQHLETWSRVRVRTALKRTANWLHAPVVDETDRPLGFVRDLVLGERRDELQGLVISQGLLQDLWNGATIVTLGRFEVDVNPCIRLFPKGNTVAEAERPEGGGKWTPV